MQKVLVHFNFTAWLKAKINDDYQLFYGSFLNQALMIK